MYGFASAYLLTGNERYLQAAEKGTVYLREHMRFQDKKRRYLCTGTTPPRSKTMAVNKKFTPRNLATTIDAIPCYEQIYALAGPTQTYRITGDPLHPGGYRRDD